jgi:hypothetical protein
MPGMKIAMIMIAALVLMSCGGDEKRPVPGRPAPVEPFDDDHTGVSQAAGKPAAVPSPAPAASNQDGPHISRSEGEEGGLIVFWPRVIPKTDDAEIRGHARELQKRLVDIAGKKFKGKIDIRPEPERVCPQQGCKAATLGVLLTHGGGGCTATALVAKPGKSPTRLIPWAGVMTLKKDQVAFREYPETQLSIRDAVPCKDLIDALAEKAKDIEGAL